MTDTTSLFKEMPVLSTSKRLLFRSPINMEVPQYDYCLLDVMPCLQFEAAGTSRTPNDTFRIQQDHILKFDIMCSYIKNLQHISSH